MVQRLGFSGPRRFFLPAAFKKLLWTNNAGLAAAQCELGSCLEKFVACRLSSEAPLNGNCSIQFQKAVAVLPVSVVKVSTEGSPRARRNLFKRPACFGRSTEVLFRNEVTGASFIYLVGAE